jgi:PAS domain S-box-containing protein
MAEKPTYEELERRLADLEKENKRLQKAEKALKEGDERLFQIIQGSSIPTFVIDRDHRISHWNRAVENLTGLPAEKMIGTREQWKAFYNHERPVMADLLVDGISTAALSRYYGDRFRQSAVIQGAYEAEGFFPHLGEEGKWLFFTAAPLKNGEGRITGAIETLQDITRRKWAEAAIRESGKRYKRFIDFVPYPVVVFTPQGRVAYLNPSFTEVFGWSLAELKDRRIPYIPSGLEEETRDRIDALIENRLLVRYETQRLTKDGRLLDMVLRAAVYPETQNEEAGILLIHRDITEEKRIARNNAAMLRISTSLPAYPELADLLDYISSEVKRLLGTEGAAVVLLDEENNELFIPGAAYDSPATEQRVKGIRFSPDQIFAGEVIRTGEPVMIQDPAEMPDQYSERDRLIGYETRNMMEVPLRSNERIIGVLAALNKKKGAFDPRDLELLNMIAGTVSLSVENARFAEEVKSAYRELKSINAAKNRMINHLSHELKTPISVMSGCLNILTSRLQTIPDEKWRSTMDRARRNLDRLSEIADEVDDIVQARGDNPPAYLFRIYEHFLDQVEGMVAEEKGDESLARSIRKKIADRFRPDQLPSRRIQLHLFAERRLDQLQSKFAHRDLEIIRRFEPTPPINMASEPLMKVIDGLVKNAVENTPDGGRIEISVENDPKGVRFTVHDYGVGIDPEAQKRIFDGFYVTQETGAYSTKRPYDFNAGGKGADLLRMKMFSARYGFSIEMTSTRCRHLPREEDICPGCIADCTHCDAQADCRDSGETTFSVLFPSALQATDPGI